MITACPYWVVEMMVPLGVDDQGETEWAPARIGSFWDEHEAHEYAAQCGGEVMVHPADPDESWPAYPRFQVA